MTSGDPHAKVKVEQHETECHKSSFVFYPKFRTHFGKVCEYVLHSICLNFVYSYAVTDSPTLSFIYCAENVFMDVGIVLQIDLV